MKRIFTTFCAITILFLGLSAIPRTSSAGGLTDAVLIKLKVAEQALKSVALEAGGTCAEDLLTCQTSVSEAETNLAAALVALAAALDDLNEHDYSRERMETVLFPQKPIGDPEACNNDPTQILNGEFDYKAGYDLHISMGFSPTEAESATSCIARNAFLNFSDTGCIKGRSVEMAKGNCYHGLTPSIYWNLAPEACDFVAGEAPGFWRDLSYDQGLKQFVDYVGIPPEEAIPLMKCLSDLSYDLGEHIDYNPNCMSCEYLSYVAPLCGIEIPAADCILRPDGGIGRKE